MKKLVLSALGAAAVAIASPAFAHHAGTMFDLQKSVAYDGVVKEFQWTNPHSWLEVTIPNAKGGADTWSLELGPLVGLQRNGWKPHTLNPGDKVKVSFHPLRDGTPGGRLIDVTFPDGHVIREGGGAPPGPAAE